MKTRKEFLILFILIGVSIFLSYPCFKDYMNIIDDMPFHLNRIMNLADNLKSGNLLPNIYGNAMNGYGYANGLFYPDLFIYIPAIFICIGFNLIQSYKLFICLVTIITSFTTFIAVKSIIHLLNINEITHEKGIFTYSEKVSLLTTIVYVAFPYRLIDIYVRGALGEVLAFIFIPIVIWGIYEIFYNENGKWEILTIGMVGLLYSHIITLFLMSIVIIILILYHYRKIKNFLFKLLKATIFSILLSSMFLFSMIEQVLSNEFYFNLHKPFGNIEDNSIKLLNINNQFILLILNLLIIIFLLYIYIKQKNKKNKKVIKYFFLGIYLCIITTNLFPWKLVSNLFPIIEQIQFPWRLFMFVCYFFSLANAIKIIDIFKKNTFKIPLLIIIFIATTHTYFFINPIAIKSKYSFNDNYIPNTEEIGNGEYFPIKINLDYVNKKGISVKDLNSIKISYEYKKNNNNASLKFYSKNDNLNLELPIIYYKGYKAYIQNKELEVYESNNGLLTIKTNSFKQGIVSIKYEHTFIQNISFLLNLISFLIFIIKFRFLNKK